MNERLKNILSKRLHLGLAVSLPLIVISSAIFTYFVFLIQPFEPWLLDEVLEANGAAVIFLNFLPILLTALTIYFAANNFVLSAGVTGFIVVALSVANRFKIVFRQDPLTTWDFVLGAELAVIARSFSPRLVIGTLGGFALIIAIIAVAMVFVRNRKMSKAVRMAGLVLSLAAAFVSAQTVFSDYHLYRNLHVSGNPYRLKDQFNSRGFLYAFIHTHITSEITQPTGFNAVQTSEHISLEAERTALAYLQRLETESVNMERHPHVIMILAEAFSELALSDGITFANDFDPAYHYRRIRDESLHGYIVVPNFGGGTADTEFDILTGINTRHYRQMAYSYMLITREFPGFVSVFNRLGFHSQAMHPGYAWFYNRQNVFEFLGFDNYMANEYFEDAPTRGGYITEEATFDRLIERFEEHLELRSNMPLLEFVITIQNHGPYDEAKHPNSYTIEFDSYPELSESDMDLLRTYFYGLADIDVQLGRIIDYFRASDEPVVVAYFSDHMPLVTRGILEAHHHPPENSPLMQELWPFIGDFTVPFIIWQNDAAAKLLEGRTPEYRTNDRTLLMSSFYFGAFVLEQLGLETADPFMNFLSELRKKIPVQLEFAYFNMQGERFSYDDELHDDVSFYKHWSYYRLFN